MAEPKKKAVKKVVKKVVKKKVSRTRVAKNVLTVAKVKKMTKKRQSSDGGKFDPEGSGYNYHQQKDSGITRADNGHLGSRHPRTGQALKGRKHKTWNLYVNGETKAGYQIRKDDNGRYYSSKGKKGVKVDNTKFLNKKGNKISKVQKSKTTKKKTIRGSK